MCGVGRVELGHQPDRNKSANVANHLQNKKKNLCFSSISHISKMRQSLKLSRTVHAGLEITVLFLDTSELPDLDHGFSVIYLCFV